MTGLSKNYVGQQPEWMELKDFAKGKIQGDSEKLERLDEATERVGRGEYHRPVNGNFELKLLPARCVDGRTPENGASFLVPNSAGGTESLMVADDLTAKRFAAPDGTTRSAYENMVTALAANGYVVGGHTDSYAEGETSGCGANDKLPLIYDYIARHGGILRGLAKEFGIAVDEEAHEMITSNAAARTQFSKGRELLEVLKAKAEQGLVDNLQGSHNEVVTAINLRTGTTLDRDALAAEFGPEYQAFNVDAWAFGEAAEVISFGDTEARQKAAALAYYNLATAMVLAGPKMRVVAVR